MPFLSTHHQRFFRAASTMLVPRIWKSTLAEQSESGLCRDYRATQVLFPLLNLGHIARRCGWRQLFSPLSLSPPALTEKLYSSVYLYLLSYGCSCHAPSNSGCGSPSRCWISVWRGVILVYTQRKPLRRWPLKWASSCSCREEVGWVPKSYSF